MFACDSRCSSSYDAFVSCLMIAVWILRCFWIQVPTRCLLLRYSIAFIAATTVSTLCRPKRWFTTSTPRRRLRSSSAPPGQRHRRHGAQRREAVELPHLDPPAGGARVRQRMVRAWPPREVDELENDDAAGGGHVASMLLHTRAR